MIRSTCLCCFAYTNSINHTRIQRATPGKYLHSQALTTKIPPLEIAYTLVLLCNLTNHYYYFWHIKKGPEGPFYYLRTIALNSCISCCNTAMSCRRLLFSCVNTVISWPYASFIATISSCNTSTEEIGPLR